MFPGSSTVSAAPHAVTSGPEKTVVLFPAGCETSMLATKGARANSKISIDVANAGVEKRTRSHSGDVSPDEGAHALWLVRHVDPTSRTLRAPVACAAE